MMNEQQLEDLCIGWFQETGWQFVHGPDIAPDSAQPERTDYRQAILQGLAKVRQSLGGQGASERAARLALQMLQ